MEALSLEQADEIERCIRKHQLSIAQGDTGLENMICKEWIYSGNEDPESLDASVIQCLQVKYSLEAEESNAWASYYVGLMALSRDGQMEQAIHLFEKSFVNAKSCILRYLASGRLADCYGDMNMNKPLDAIRYCKKQLQEAEATTWKRAKIYALYNLCIYLIQDKQFVEAVEIVKKLSNMGQDDPLARGLGFQCRGRIQFAMQDYKACIEDTIEAISILESEDIFSENDPDIKDGIVMKNCITKAIFDCEACVGFARHLDNSADQLHTLDPDVLDATSLFSLSVQENVVLDRCVIQHQYSVLMGNVDLEMVAFMTMLYFFNEGLNDPESLHQGIIQCLEGKCKMEALESKAWASYYVGYIMTLVPSGLKVARAIDLFEQSLAHGKSSILRYRASWSLANCFQTIRNSVDTIRCCRIQLQELEALRTWKNEKIYALYGLCSALCPRDEFVEATQIQNMLKSLGHDNKVAKGLSFTCEGLIAHAMRDYERCIIAHRKAISILENDFKSRFLNADLNEETNQEIKALVFILLNSKSCTDVENAFKAAQNCFQNTHMKEVIESAISGGKRQIWWSQIEQQASGKLKETIDQGLHADYLSLQEQEDDQIDDEEAGKAGEELPNLESLSLLGQMHLHDKNYIEAENVARKLLSLSQEYHDVGNHASALMILAKVAFHAENEEQTEIHFAEAERLMSLEPESLRLVLRNAAEVYYRMGKMDKAVEKLQVLLGMFMAIEDKFKYLSLGRICYLENMKRSFGYIQASLSILGDERRAFIWNERQRTRDLLYAIRNKLSGNAYLKSLSEFDKNDGEAWSELQQVCSLVGQDTIFLILSKIGVLYISYFFQAMEEPIASLVYEVEPGRVRRVGEENSFDFPFPFPVVHEGVDFMRTMGGQWQQYMKYLFFIFLSPWKEKLRKAAPKKIIIVPNEEISLIPFAALIDPEDGEFLIQKYEISTISSLRLLKHCELRRQELIKMNDNQSALVVGNPEGDLPSAKEEAQIVNDILLKTGLNPNLLMEKEATREVVSASLPKSCWIHMSCHTLFDDNVPNGALVLSSTSRRRVRAGRREVSNTTTMDVLGRIKSSPNVENLRNLLTAEQIAEGDELSAVVAVLGACSSGKGQICAEGTLGLTRSLHLAGITTVVASLWTVDDLGTKEFMKRLYTNLHVGLPLSKSLRKTMLSMIEEREGNNQPRFQPLHWAPFFISGSPSICLSDICSHDGKP